MTKFHGDVMKEGYLLIDAGGNGTLSVIYDNKAHKWSVVKGENGRSIVQAQLDNFPQAAIYALDMARYFYRPLF